MTVIREGADPPRVEKEKSSTRHARHPPLFFDSIVSLIVLFFYPDTVNQLCT